MIARIQIAFLLFTLVEAEAQVISEKGRFAVSFDRGCVPMRIDIEELDAFGEVTRQYYYFRGADISNNKTFTYDSEGRFEIVQVVGVDNIEDKTDTLIVYADVARKPEVSLTQCGNLGLSLQSHDSFYDFVRIYFDEKDSATLKYQEMTSHSFLTPSLKVIGIKGFFENADPVCATYFEEISILEELPISQVLDVSVKKTCEQRYSLSLTINEFDALVWYRINLTQEATQYVLHDGYLATTDLIFEEIPFKEQPYCIEVETHDICTDKSVKRTKLCKELSENSLSPFERLYSSYQGDAIYLHFDSVHQGVFEIERKRNEGDYEYRTSVNAPYTDSLIQLSRLYHYRITYVDACGDTLYQAQTHPPFIETQRLGENSYQIHYVEGKNSIAPSPIHSYYELKTAQRSLSREKVASNPFEIKLRAFSELTPRLLRVESLYRSGEILHSNTLSLQYKKVVYVPRAFTPNNDSLNDRLSFFGIPSGSDVFITIYTRWGQRLATLKDPTMGWDGKVNGTIAPRGTYLYEITYQKADNTFYKQRGTFALIR